MLSLLTGDGVQQDSHKDPSKNLKIRIFKKYPNAPPNTFKLFTLLKIEVAGFEICKMYY